MGNNNITLVPVFKLYSRELYILSIHRKQIFVLDIVSNGEVVIDNALVLGFYDIYTFLNECILRKKICLFNAKCVNSTHFLGCI